jgi:hypothetical protein
MAKFERDIVIANDDGKVYHLTQADLNKLEHVDLGDNRYQLINGLLEQGVSTAAIPTPDDPGPEPDAFCYLLNLGSFRKRQPYED